MNATLANYTHNGTQFHAISTYMEIFSNAGSPLAHIPALWSQLTSWGGTSYVRVLRSTLA
jgi:hypothetical protein